MAKFLDKDPTTYGRERDGFVRDLQHFHETRGTPFKRIPKIGGREIDLYLLYSLVTAKGGWMKVNSRNEWNELLDKFELPSKCANSAVAIKQLYIRYLDRYEKVHFLGEEADRGSDDDEESRHKRWSARALHSVPLSYNHHQHNIAESLRSYNGLSDNLYKSSDYDRLALSLISPLPNEQDFAVNVCTLLSNEGKHTLKLDKCPRLVDFLLAHAGVFSHSSLRNVFADVYLNVRKHSVSRFWQDTCETQDVIDLTDESKFYIRPPRVLQVRHAGTKFPPPCSRKTDEHPDQNQCAKTRSSDVVNVDLTVDSSSELFVPADSLAGTSKVQLKLEPQDNELFCTGRTLGTQDYVGQRVLQIANILRNLSFTEENVSVLAANRTFLRFLVLCASSRWHNLHQLGSDMLGNVATEVLVKDPKDRLTECLLNVITKGVLSDDRFLTVSSLEIINKLSQKEANEETMSKCLDQKVYDRICSFLTLHDVMLLIYTLECLYSLSSLGERACNSIVNVHGIVDTLVSLVTVEGKSYGPKACIGMKLVETVPGTATTLSTSSSVSTSTSSVMASSAVTSASSASRPTTPSTTMRNVPVTPQKIASSQVATAVLSTPTTSISVVTPTVVQTTVTAQPTPQQLVQQQHAHQQIIQENEQFALTWLRATCEPFNTGKIEQQELYKQYLNSCAKIGRRGVIAPLHFPRCVRSVFGGTVGPNPLKNSTTVEGQYYEGIRIRPVPLVINFQSTLTQPTVTTPVKTPQKRGGKAQNITIAPNPQPTLTTKLTLIAEALPDTPASPASPILKAQLSAPPKPTPVKVGDSKSQVLAHPHLSQALLGTGAAGTAVSVNPSTSKDVPTTSVAGQSNTSLIKSLLATKVNECMIPVSMKTAALAPAAAQDCQPVAQVAQRQQQQKLLAQQTSVTQTATNTAVRKILSKPLQKSETKSKMSRINGARTPLSEAETEAIMPTSSTAATAAAVDNHITTNVLGVNSTLRGRRDPPQPPPPPLAPLSNRAKTPKLENDDSDSVGNNSLSSSTGLGNNASALGCVSSAEDGENSLTSFEGILLNGIPHGLDIDAPSNEDSNSKDSSRSVSGKPPAANRPLMLADLLEKKADKKDPPVLNGLLVKEVRIGEKGLELVENHIDKVLSKEPAAGSRAEENKEVSVIVSTENESARTLDEASENKSAVTNVKIEPLQVSDVCMKKESEIPEADVKTEQAVASETDRGVKRPASDDISEVEVKRPNTSSVIVSNNSVNGTMSVDSPKPESVASSNGDDSNNASVSATAANLYAALAADALEDEDVELLQQEASGATSVQQQQQQETAPVVPEAPPIQQFVAAAAQEGQIIVTPARQIIVSQGQIGAANQVLITAGGQILQPGSAQATATIKTPGGTQTVPFIVQAASQQPRPPQMVLSQANTGQILLQPGQGSVQLLASSTQPGQYVLASSNQGQTTYMVAQPQTALVQGQTQTVLVTQTPQQQATGSKTIIILQPQAAPTATATHHQKVVVTPQGQQVVVTQVPRPILQTSSVSNNLPTLVANQSVIQSSSAQALVKNAPAFINTVAQGLVSVVQTATTNTTPVKMIINSVKQEKVLASQSTASETPAKQIVVVPVPPPRDYSSPFICEWKGCPVVKPFKSANEVYLHACEAHCPESMSEIQCLWERCDSMTRKRFSLMTHLYDRHCSTDVMKMMAARRKQLSQSGRSEIPAPQPPPPHPGYAPDAALHAIKRHALEFVNPKELQDDNEGPVTKSIRLTASLILRNLVIYCSNSRRYLRHYEPHLAGVALSNVESSRTIAQVLYDLNESTSMR